MSVVQFRPWAPSQATLIHSKHLIILVYYAFVQKNILVFTNANNELFVVDDQLGTRTYYLCFC